MRKKALVEGRARIWAALLASLVLVPALVWAGDEERKRAEKDVDRYGRAIDRNPDQADNYYRLAVAYITLERYERAREPLATYLEKRPEDPKGLFWMGRVTEEAGNCREALAIYDKALAAAEAHPDKGGQVKPASLARKGSCQNSLGRLEEALANYRAALEAGAEDRTGLLVNIGSIYNKMGKQDKAREALDEVVAQNPNDPTVHYNLGVVLRQAAKKRYDAGLFRQAARSFARAAELARDPQYHFLAGETYLFADDADAARPHLETYLKLAPHGPNAAEAKEYLSMF